MTKYLIIDVGAGTIDILCFDQASGIHYKVVAKSPVASIAERVPGLTGNLLITGCEMGGGSLSAVLKSRAAKDEIVMSQSAAYTLHHDLERVRAWGITVVDDAEADAMRGNPRYSALEVGDLEIERLRQLIEGLGIAFSFDVVGVCAQDHGTAPQGVSHLDYRHNLFVQALDNNPFPHALLYAAHEIPVTFNRLRSIAESARRLPASEIYVMDSGMAAILGASLDASATAKEHIAVLDVATSHTVAATLRGGEILGFFEYHTHDITLDRLEFLLRELADGKLVHQRILEEGGHGAYLRMAVGYDRIETIIATGPKRRLLLDSKLPIVFGAPFGDNMMTGTLGVLQAIQKRKGLAGLDGVQAG